MDEQQLAIEVLRCRADIEKIKDVCEKQMAMCEKIMQAIAQMRAVKL
jgi:hypothetical protein